MIGFIPKAYPDELIYSVLARAYVADGYMIYREFAKDIFKNAKKEPSYEYLGNLKEDVLDRLCFSYGVGNITDLVRAGTQYPYYTRFYPIQRKLAALKALLTDEKVNDLIRLTTSREARFFRYCPRCVLEDRKRFGETYWHRAHQMKGVRNCGVHGLRLLNSNLMLTGKASPNFYNAQLSLADCDMSEIVAPETEVKLARYNAALLEAPLDLDGSTTPLNVICNALWDKGFISKKGGAFYLSKANAEMSTFYKACPNEVLNTVQIGKLLAGKRIQPIDYARLAVFLDIEVDDLLAGVKLKYRAVKKSRIRGKGGCTPKDWNKIDEEKLASVVAFVKGIKARENVGERPVRITANLVANHIGVCVRSFPKLPQCAAYVEQFEESQEEYWARELVWAHKKMEAEGSLICYKGFRNLLNVRRRYIEEALPFVEDDNIKNVLAQI